MVREKVVCRQAQLDLDELLSGVENRRGMGGV